MSTYSGVKRKLVGADGREVGSHALGIRGGVHGQGRYARSGQPLVAKVIRVLTRADGLPGDRVGENGPAGVAAPGRWCRGRGRGCGGAGGRADRGYGCGRTGAVADRRRCRWCRTAGGVARQR